MFKMKHNVNPANVMDYDKQQTRFELEAIAWGPNQREEEEIKM